MTGEPSVGFATLEIAEDLSATLFLQEETSVLKKILTLDSRLLPFDGLDQLAGGLAHFGHEDLIEDSGSEGLVLVHQSLDQT